MDLLVHALAVQGVTSVFVEHDMEMVERYADRVAVWSSGRIQSVGPPDRVLTDPAVMRDVIGV
jgi:branched-chain amino acid transport system ATP-binding protein